MKLDNVFSRAPLIALILAIFAQPITTRSLPRAPNAPCYYPGGEAALLYQPCDQFAFVTACCPQGFTCFSNNICILTDPAATTDNVEVGKAFRPACTNPFGDTQACGNYCQDEGSSGELTSCGGDTYCCRDAELRGECDCETGDGTIYRPPGRPETIIGMTGVNVTTIPPLSPSSTVASTAATTTPAPESNSASPTPSSSESTPTSGALESLSESNVLESTSKTISEESASASGSQDSTAATSPPETSSASEPTGTSEPASSSEAPETLQTIASASSTDVAGAAASSSPPTSTAPPPAAANTNPGGRSNGEIAGIAFGSTVAGILLIGALIFYCRRRQQKSRAAAASPEDSYPNLVRSTTVYSGPAASGRTPSDPTVAMSQHTAPAMPPSIPNPWVLPPTSQQQQTQTQPNTASTYPHPLTAHPAPASPTFSNPNNEGGAGAENYTHMRPVSDVSDLGQPSGSGYQQPATSTNYSTPYPTVDLRGEGEEAAGYADRDAYNQRSLGPSPISPAVSPLNGFQLPRRPVGDRREDVGGW